MTVTQTDSNLIKAPVDLDGQPHDECGGVFRLASEIRGVRVGQSDVSVEQSLFRCDGCGEERQTLTQLADARRTAALVVRQRDALLSPEEIRSIRKGLQLTQPQLEAALGLGAKTVVRWETGKVLQPKATDNLLRLLARDPTTLRYLAKHNGAELPPAALTGASSCTITIPKRIEPQLNEIAAREGMDPRSYVAWILAEQLTSARFTHHLDRRIDAMHADLQSFRKSMERAWTMKSFRKPYPYTVSPHSIPFRREQPYAKRA